MKKIFILLVMLGVYGSSFAFLTQSSWRWRNNDGSETTATWRAAQNTATFYANFDSVLRLRVEIYNNLSNDETILDSLQYTTTPLVAGSWLNIPITPGRAFIIAGKTLVNGLVVQDGPTTAQLTGVAYPFVPGKINVDSAVMKGVLIPVSNRTEVEWAIKGTSSILPNTTYYFRHWGSSSNSLPPGATYPSLTTSGTVPVKLSDFSVKKDGKKVTLNWSTAFEQNNDRFEVERSTDSRTWSTIATVKGNGNSNQLKHYNSIDTKPINGLNYYRLKQYDVDGRFTLSETRSLKFDERTNAFVSVSPNPVISSVNFKLENMDAANVLATLSDANGKIIHQQTFKNVQANTNNNLNLKQKPTAGIYILKLKAEGLSESIKIVVQ